MEFVLCTSMYKMFICNINCAILTFFLILIFISFRAISLQILLVLKQGVFQDKMLILTTFRNSGGGRTTFKKLRIRRFSDDKICNRTLRRQYYLRSFSEKVTKDITPWFFKFSRICPSKLHESEFWLT